MAHFIVFSILVLILLRTTICVRNYSLPKPKFSILTKGCRIYYQDPFSNVVKPYILPQNRISCGSDDPLILSDQSFIWINKRSKMSKIYHGNPNCCYKRMLPPTPPMYNDKQTVDNVLNFGSNCALFQNQAMIHDEYVEVICFDRRHIIYRDYHAFVRFPRRENIRRRTKQNAMPSVLLLGLSSVSRGNFYRQMPETAKFLHKHGAYEFYGFNTIGDKTFPNVMGMLLGLNEDEMRQKCWPGTANFDFCDFVWKQFKDNGYTTAFGEDQAYYGLFKHVKRGFRFPPTDYYLHPFMHLHETLQGKFYKTTHHPVCSAQKPFLKVLLDYTKKFCKAMDEFNNPYFALFWGSSLTHDDFNFPPNVDLLYSSIFSFMAKEGFLENTLVIFMSDHGVRFSTFRNSYQGYVEERQPFLFIMVPPWIRNRYPHAVQNLIENQNSLTTPFDVGATMRNMLKMKDFGSKYHYNRGTSLFSKLSTTRNCHDASIPQNYCLCLVEDNPENVDLNSIEVRFSARAIVQAINKMLLHNNSCLPLHLVLVESAKLITEAYDNDPLVREYLISIVAIPGNGQFEATVRFYKKSEMALVIGNIIRTNSIMHVCTTDLQIQHFCECRIS